VTVEVSAKIGAMIVEVAVASGVARDAFDFDAAVAADPDARIPIATETALWEQAARLTGDATFGLTAAMRVRPGAFDVLDYAIRTAPTLRAALERLARYNRLVHDAAVFTLIDRGAIVRVEHDLGGVAQSRHAAEFTIGALVTVGGQLIGAPLRPRVVELRVPPPASFTAYERLFGVRPRFDADVNAIELDRATLDRPAVTADPSLSAVIVRHAEALLGSLPAPSASTADRVRRAIADTLGDGDVSLAAIAARLKQSERTLQRHLAEDGVTFDALVEELRRDLALRYLADQRMAIAEIAYLLGYSEPSAFHRAFKRWTGQTPAEARKRAA
jgi:AraC-like DNA-binding protein